MGTSFPAKVQSGRRVTIPPEAFEALEAEVGDYVDVNVDDYPGGDGDE